MTGILTMVTIVNYWLLVPMVVMGFLFHKVRGTYVATAQDIKRLEGISKSLTLVEKLACFINSAMRSCLCAYVFDFEMERDISGCHTSLYTML
jgi:hypothetical protein